MLSGSLVLFAKPVSVLSLALSSLALTSMVEMIDYRLPIVKE